MTPLNLDLSTPEPYESKFQRSLARNQVLTTVTSWAWLVTTQKKKSWGTKKGQRNFKNKIHLKIGVSLLSKIHKIIKFGKDF